MAFLDFQQDLIDKKKLIVITGPTASGKTAAAIELSKYLDLEVISADSRQCYKYLDIGTAKPTMEELDRVKHHFIDIIEPDEYFSAGLFGNQAREVAISIFEKNKLPVVVGGSGLYIQSLCEGLFAEDFDKNNFDIRQNLELRLKSEGIDQLYEELKNIDKESAELYLDKNPRRIIRALEFFYQTGKPISMSKKKSEILLFGSIYFGISIEREILYHIINKRAEFMWNNGLIEETQKVLDLGFSKDLNSLNTVGYKECIEYLNKNLNKEEALNLTQQNTRRYAKRQMTWFKKSPKINWISGNTEEIAKCILKSTSSLI